MVRLMHGMFRALAVSVSTAMAFVKRSTLFAGSDHPLAVVDNRSVWDKDVTLDWLQLGEDIDGEADWGLSGFSVSLSATGSRVAIGTPDSYNEIADNYAGHVRVYAFDSGSWMQLGADIEGESTGDRSGFWVSLSADGSRVAIGANNNDDAGHNAGHVRVYAFDGESWMQLGADIDGESQGDYSGTSVSLSADGSRVAIGAYGNDDAGNNAGHVRVFAFDEGSWSQLGTDIDGEFVYDESGRSVSLSADGSRVAMSAPLHGSRAGHVRVFAFDGESWAQLGADIPGEAKHDRSGSVSLSADGSRVAIGAYGNDDAGYYAGHVRVYAFDGESWMQLGADIDGEAAGDHSGISVSLSADGSRVAIGADGNDDAGYDAGHVRVFAFDGGSWSQLGTDIDGEAGSDRSGTSVSLSADGSHVAIGAFGNQDGGHYAGHVRVFKLDESIASAPDTSVVKGDPHVQNMKGQSFNIWQLGSVSLLRVPSFDPFVLTVNAVIENLGGNHTCMAPYITSLHFGGELVGHFDVGVTRQGKLTLPEPGSIAMRTTTKVISSSDHMVRMHVRDARITVRAVRGRLGAWLTLKAENVSSLSDEVGGLLGSDDHAAVSRFPSQCVGKTAASLTRWELSLGDCVAIASK